MFLGQTIYYMCQDSMGYRDQPIGSRHKHCIYLIIYLFVFIAVGVITERFLPTEYM